MIFWSKFTNQNFNPPVLVLDSVVVEIRPLPQNKTGLTKEWPFLRFKFFGEFSRKGST